MDVQLPHGIAEGGDIELFACCDGLESTSGARQLAHEDELIVLVEIDDVDEARPSRYQNEPRIVGVLHDQHARQGQIAQEGGIGGQPRVERPG
jgi:hypothetical protein